MKKRILFIILTVALSLAGNAQSAHPLFSAVLSPNPVEDKVDLNFEQPIKEDLQIVVKDLTGKTVYTLHPTMDGEDCYRVSMDLEFLRRGIYIMQITSTSGKTKTLKLQKT